MPATFAQQFRVRFDECSPDGTAGASALLRYVIETAFGHSAAVFTGRAGAPTRVVPEMEAAFPGLSTHLESAPLRLETPPPDLRPAEHVVAPHLVDPRGHMNSAAYLDLFEDALAALGVNPQQRPAACRLEYARQAQAGEMLRQVVWRSTGRWAMQASTREGQVVVMATWQPGAVPEGTA